MAHGTTDPALECTGLVVRYGDLTAVDGLDLSAAQGEVLALLGPNGAGKTSTVETLEGYRRPHAGTVRVLGLDPRTDHRALMPRIGVMLQRGGVYPSLCARQALSLFAAYYDDPEDPAALLDLLGLTAVARTPWRRLSGGEQQRLSLALALVGKPRVVFLDEPTAGVDPEGRLSVRDTVTRLRDQGICVLLTTHELAEAERLADRVVIIAHGTKLAEGTPAELARGSADGAIRFTAAPGLDTTALAAGIAPGAHVAQERTGEYRLTAPAGMAAPDAVAALATALAALGHTLGDLRTGRTLEETYLAITGEAAAGDGDGTDQHGHGQAPGGRRAGRRHRTSAPGAFSRSPRR